MKECLSSSFKAVMLINILQVTGAVLVTVGVWAIFVPAGLIVAGLFAILFGLSLERK